MSSKSNEFSRKLVNKYLLLLSQTTYCMKKEYNQIPWFDTRPKMWLFLAISLVLCLLIMFAFETSFGRTQNMFVSLLAISIYVAAYIGFLFPYNFVLDTDRGIFYSQTLFLSTNNPVKLTDVQSAEVERKYLRIQKQGGVKFVRMRHAHRAADDINNATLRN